MLAGFLRAGQGSLLGRQWHLEQGLAIMRGGTCAHAGESTCLILGYLAFATAWYAFLNVNSGRFQKRPIGRSQPGIFPTDGDRSDSAGCFTAVWGREAVPGPAPTCARILQPCVEICKAMGSCGSVPTRLPLGSFIYGTGSSIWAASILKNRCGSARVATTVQPLGCLLEYSRCSW